MGACGIGPAGVAPRVVQIHRGLARPTLFESAASTLEAVSRPLSRKRGDAACQGILLILPL